MSMIIASGPTIGRTRRLGQVRDAGSTSVPPPSAEYRAIVESIPDLLAEWEFNDTGFIEDYITLGGGGGGLTHPLALPYPVSGLSASSASSIPALETQVSSATPTGRHVSVTANLSGTINLSGANGSADHPIVIRPNGSVGTRSISGTINITNCSYVFIIGFLIPNLQINYFGTSHHCRVSRCEGATISVASSSGVFNFDDTTGSIRIDHNKCGNTGAVHNFFRVINRTSTCPSGFLFDHNHGYNSPDRGANGGEWGRFGIGNALGPKNSFDADIDCQYNLVEDWDSDDEVVTAKINGVRLKGNTWMCGLTKNTVSVSARTHAMRCESDWLGDNMQMVRAVGTGCFFAGVRAPEIRVFCGDTTSSAINAGNAPFGNSYPASIDAIIRGCKTDLIRVGYSFGNPTPTIGAQNTLIQQCTPVGGGTALSIGNGVVLERINSGTTTQATTSLPFTPAVQLTAGQVGVAAADPYNGGSTGPGW